MPISPTMVVEVAFGNDYTDASPTWTDVTAYVRGLDLRRGRSYELDTTQPGTATVLFDNSDRRFEPEYTSGAYTPDVLPMVPIRIRATYTAVTYDLFRGFVTGWPQSYPHDGHDAISRVRCVDAFALFNVHSPTPYREVVLADNPVAFWPLDDDNSGQSAHAMVGPDLLWNDPTDVTQLQTLSGGPGDSPVGTQTIDNGEYASTQDDSSLMLTGDLSIEMWLGGSDTGDVRTLISSWYYDSTGGGVDGAFIVQLDDSGTTSRRMYFGWATSGTSATGNTRLLDFLSYDANVEIFAVDAAVDSNFTTPDGHWVFVRDAANETVRVYQNGERRRAGQWQPWVTPATSADTEFRLGGANGAQGGTWLGVLSHVAVYDKALTAGQVASHYAARTFESYAGETSGARIGNLLDGVAWPSGARDVDTGLSTFARYAPSGNTLQLLRNAADAEGGWFFMGQDGDAVFQDRDSRFGSTTVQVTFGDGGGSERPIVNPVWEYDTNYLWNEAHVEAFDGSQLIASDSTSQGTYGPRVLSKSARFATAEDAQHQADWLVATYKDPRLRIRSVTVKPEKDPSNMYPDLLNLELGERVAVKITPPGGGTRITKDVFVENIRHRVTPKEWVTTLQLSPAGVSEVWIVEDATYGAPDEYPVSY